MTFYYIEIGYNPCNTNDKKMWQTLKEEARKVADHPELIVAEARRLGAPEVCEEGCCPLESYADNYKGNFGENGHPIFIENNQIIQMASTDKGFKYHIRRAYVRLLIEAMHKHFIEVNLTVA